MTEVCPLCKSIGKVFFCDNKRYFYSCDVCLGIFMGKKYRLLPEEEKQRYEQHNNDINDPRYRKFAAPIIYEILKNHSPSQSGLDFGSGTGPVIAKVLTENNFKVEKYDPFFDNHPELLKKKYDFIFCCEVIEHFYDPAGEFLLIYEMLNNNGKLYCMTDFYNSEISFKDWYYKNDPTHVFFFRTETMFFIQKTYGFSSLKTENRLAVFTK